jgi:hypothetical protein
MSNPESIRQLADGGDQGEPHEWRRKHVVPRQLGDVGEGREVEHTLAQLQRPAELLEQHARRKDGPAHRRSEPWQEPEERDRDSNEHPYCEQQAVS